VIKKILMGIGITIGAGLITAGISWNFLATANMSNKFVQKSDFIKFTECNERDHERINDKLDRIYETLMDYYRLTARSTSPADYNEIDAEYNLRE
jgi:ribonuclease HIII